MFGFKKAKDVILAGSRKAAKYASSGYNATMDVVTEGYLEAYPVFALVSMPLTGLMIGAQVVSAAVGLSIFCGVLFSPILIPVAVALVAGAVGVAVGVTNELNKPSEQNPVPQMTPSSPAQSTKTKLQKKAGHAFRAVAKSVASAATAANTNKAPVIQAKNSL